MPLPYRVESLDDVPEAARELYEQDGDGFKLPVEGVKTADEIAGLESALDKIKRERNELRDKAGKWTDDDAKDLARLRKAEKDLEEKKAKEEGRWDEMRAKIIEEKDGEIQQVTEKLSQRDTVIERLTVTNELRAAISAAGVNPDYHEAVEALLQRKNPKVVWEDGEMPKGVFPDDLHGPKPISEFVETWAKSKDAEPYMPRKQAPGGGGTGQDVKMPETDKKYGEMTVEQKKVYLDQKYGGEAAA